jgi:hypothetical protein
MATAPTGGGRPRPGRPYVSSSVDGDVAPTLRTAHARSPPTGWHPDPPPQHSSSFRTGLSSHGPRPATAGNPRRGRSALDRPSLRVPGVATSQPARPIAIHSECGPISPVESRFGHARIACGGANSRSVMPLSGPPTAPLVDDRSWCMTDRACCAGADVDVSRAA